MSIYGDMNYYGDLLRVEGSCVYYKYGCRLDNLTGIMMIDTGEGTWTNIKLPDGIERETEMFCSFANKVLSICKKGEIQDKVSREIG